MSIFTIKPHPSLHNHGLLPPSLRAANYIFLKLFQSAKPENKKEPMYEIGMRHPIAWIERPFERYIYLSMQDFLGTYWEYTFIGINCHQDIKDLSLIKWEESGNGVETYKLSLLYLEDKYLLTNSAVSTQPPTYYLNPIK